ncbi:MAG: hypothetical protein ABSH25_02525 [Syntrophorhabdales bacterium]|jgi:hypothetical protein
MRRERRLTKIILATTTSTQDSGLFDALIRVLGRVHRLMGRRPMSVPAWN